MQPHRPVVTLSVTSQELYTPVISRLLYVSVSLNVFGSVHQALVDSGSAINIVHDSVVASLKIPVRPCVGPKVTLADGKTSLYCNSFVSLSCTVAGLHCQDTFFVAPIGAQAMILGMPFL